MAKTEPGRCREHEGVRRRARSSAHVKVERSRTVAATPGAIWDLLADFGSISSWIDDVDHSCVLVTRAEPIGTARRVQLGRITLVERITEYEPRRALMYSIEGLPPVFGAVSNRWSMRPVSSSQTVVTLTSTVVKGASLPTRLIERVAVRLASRSSDAMLAALATRLETSHV